jgi:hypothetical protein
MLPACSFPQELSMLPDRDEQVMQERFELEYALNVP